MYIQNISLLNSLENQIAQVVSITTEKYFDNKHTTKNQAHVRLYKESFGNLRELSESLCTQSLDTVHDFLLMSY